MSLSNEMQTAQIDGDGTQFAYVDSGAPQSDTYTTVVCVHGFTFNALTFSRLLPLAHKYNLRIIALNRRDYAGSTPFSDAELDVVRGKDDHAHKDFLQKRGLEIARFLVWVISEKKIPRTSEDGTLGGLALLGWSLGNATTLSFLAHLDSYPREVIIALEPYLKTFFLYDAPNQFLGYPNPGGGYFIFSDTEIPQDKVGAAFARWVSSYFTHPAYSGIATGGTPPVRSLESLQQRMPERPYRVCTTDTLTGEELLLITETAPLVRSEQQFAENIQVATFGEQARRALLFGANEDLLPELNVRHVYGPASEWHTQWAVWGLEKDYATWRAEGKRVRPIQFIPVEGGNHFMHLDEPDMLLKVLKDAVSA
ncbi:Alpha/Beta hydrolase protein [Phellopilus nigrolimitatus]|nr:Alpha/Beta hydrolase protein [Phellopilus nigrolimitatus]